MSDSRGRPLPRQLLRVQRSEPEEGVLRTELRFVVYQRKSDLDEEGSTEASAVVQALEALLKKFSEMNDDPKKNKSCFVKGEKPNDWSTLAEKRLKLLSTKLSLLEHSASQIAPEVANFQVQLQSLLEELDERKKGGQSPSSQLDAKFREKLQKLRDYALRTAIVAPTAEPIGDDDRLSWSSNGNIH